LTLRQAQGPVFIPIDAPIDAPADLQSAGILFQRIANPLERVRDQTHGPNVLISMTKIALQTLLTSLF